MARAAFILALVSLTHVASEPITCINDFKWMSDVCTIPDRIQASCLLSDLTPLLKPEVDGNSTYEAADRRCQCTKAYFNAVVACHLCQGHADSVSLKWSQWTKPCPFDSINFSPSGMREQDIPKWLLINTTPQDTFDAVGARNSSADGSRWSTTHIAIIAASGAIALVSILMIAFLCTRFRRNKRSSFISGDGSSSFIPRFLKTNVRKVKQSDRKSTGFDLADDNDDQALMAKHGVEPYHLHDNAFTPSVGTTVEEPHVQASAPAPEYGRVLRIDTDDPVPLHHPRPMPPMGPFVRSTSYREAAADVAPFTPLPSTPPGFR